MKRIISLLLVFVLCLALPMTAMAAEPSPGGDPPDKTGDTAQLGLWITIMVVSLLLLIVAVVVFRKTMKNN